ncbi:spore germination protein GerW family protein [Nocardioides ungokensis]|uniref:spore germination protein GerW family protein n=1 Tax=Nocardioides ungokensis TaxID=1643322 RepID=UPI0015DE7FDF|nr:spore germination protein GerW family protein [Nocardioides ungokensis]
MKVADVVNTARDAITVKRVYGEPYEKDGLTVIPAAVVSGGGGGGTGHDEKGQEGEGGGFGVTGRPVGAYVIRNGEVSWRPALDPNRILTIAGLVVIAYLISRPRVVRARAATAKWQLLAARARAKRSAA